MGCDGVSVRPARAIAQKECDVLGCLDPALRDAGNDVTPAIQTYQSLVGQAEDQVADSILRQ